MWCSAIDAVVPQIVWGQEYKLVQAQSRAPARAPERRTATTDRSLAERQCDCRSTFHKIAITVGALHR